MAKGSQRTVTTSEMEEFQCYLLKFSKKKKEIILACLSATHCYIWHRDKNPRHTHYEPILNPFMDC